MGAQYYRKETPLNTKECCVRRRYLKNYQENF